MHKKDKAILLLAVCLATPALLGETAVNASVLCYGSRAASPFSSSASDPQSVQITFGCAANFDPTASGASNGGASATASYGQLSAGASSQSRVGGIGVQSNSSALFTDQLTIFGGSGAGFISYQVNAMFGGLIGMEDTGSPQAAFTLSQNGTQVLSGSSTSLHVPEVCAFLGDTHGCGFSNSGLSLQQNSIPFPFTFGQPFDLTGQLNASATGISSASATVSIRAVHVFDSGGSPINSFSISSASGATYGSSAVPEPATYLTAGIGITLLLGVRLRRLVSDK